MNQQQKQIDSLINGDVEWDLTEPLQELEEEVPDLGNADEPDSE